MKQKHKILFCGNNSISRTDIYGEFFILACALVGAGVGIAANGYENKRKGKKFFEGWIGAAAGGALGGALFAIGGGTGAIAFVSASTTVVINELTPYFETTAKINKQEKNPLHQQI